MKNQNQYWMPLWWLVKGTMKFLMLLLFAFSAGAELILSAFNQVLKDILKIN